MDYWAYILLIDPARMIIAATYSGLFLFFGHRIREGADDWVREQEIARRKKLLPQGEYDYNDRSHMLLFGATRTGKGVALNHIIRERLRSITSLFDHGVEGTKIQVSAGHSDIKTTNGYCRSEICDEIDENILEAAL